MKIRTPNLTQAMILIFTLMVLFAPVLESPAQAQIFPGRDETAITLDGIQDAGYIRVANDPANDLANPGPGGYSGTVWADLTELYVAANSTTLFVFVPLTYTAASEGQIGLAIDTDGISGSGGATDPWGNAINLAYNNVNGLGTSLALLPDTFIRGNVSNAGGWTELRTWNGNWNTGAGTNWGGITSGHVGTKIAYAYNNGVEFAIPLVDIGSPDLANVKIQFFTTQSGGNKGAYDTLPSDDQSTGWDDATTLTQLVSVPLATDPAGDLANPGPATWVGVAWTDVTRLHVFADAANLHVFIPMPAYSAAVSTGQFLLALDTKPGGGTTDPWGNAIGFDYNYTHQNLGSQPQAVATTLPDYVIRGHIFSNTDNGWTELRTWNGSNFNTGTGVDWGGIGDSGSGSQPGSKVSWADGFGLRLRIPFADIGINPEDSVNLQFLTTQSGGGKGAYDTLPSDDQSTGWDDPTTQDYLSTFEIPRIQEEEQPEIIGTCSPGGASQDDNIWWGEVGHNSRDTLYRSPAGAVPTGTQITLRLRAACGDLSSATVRVYNDRLNTDTLLPMTRVLLNGQYEWWEANLPVSSLPTIYWYRFIVKDGTSTAYYEDDAQRTGGWGQVFNESQDNSWQLSIFDPTFATPEWVKNAVIYQIFTDRFRDGDPTNNTPAGSFHYDLVGGSIERSNTADWNTVVCDPRSALECPNIWGHNFYGGDLAGITEKLDYLEDLGVTALYLNPIFEAPSNHKYDTTDYSKIDDNFGTFAEFETLITQANTRGIRVILDGVFNHVSSDSVYFDRYGRYPAVGACESHTSPYRSWFYFTDVTPGTGGCVSSTGVANAANYESWFGFDSLPKLNAFNPEVKDLIYSGSLWQTGQDGLAKYWMQFADGWRLDVGGDVDPGTINDPNNLYWEEFRAAMRAANPDTYIVGEEWGNASSWLLGTEWDATMNYQYGTALLGFWRDTQFVDNDHNQGSSAGVINPLTPQMLDERLHNWIERYPSEALYAMMNLLGSHDTNRALFLLDHNAATGTDSSVLKNPAYDWSDAIARLRGTALLLMTIPGAPTIYYGDEVGLVGPVTYAGGKWEDDPYNRQPYPWLDEAGVLPFYTHLQTQQSQDELREYFATLTQARGSHPALQTGSFDTLLVDNANEVYAFGRKLVEETGRAEAITDAAVVIVNRKGTIAAPTAQEVTVDVKGYLPVGATFSDVLSSATATVNSEGKLVIQVPGESGVVLVATGGLANPPATPTNLAVTGVGPGTVDLSWSAAAGATGYDIYRSPLSGGGYRLVGSTAGLTFADSGLVNAYPYYYVVVSTNDTTLLESDPSAEVSAIPAWDLTTAYYNLQWPYSINHTISTITPTELIYGQIYVGGGTDATSGQLPGIRAQVGYGPAGDPPSAASWVWTEMSFHSEDGNNDQYAGMLLPDMVGSFLFTTRYSADNGQTWYYTDRNGAPFNAADAGTLTVVSSEDTAPPAAPANLEIAYTSPSIIVLEWDAPADADVAGYEVYRQQTSRAGNAFVKIGSVPTDETEYEDSAVTSGETYQYYVAAFDTSFNLSAASNTIEAEAVARLVDVTFTVRVPTGTPGTIYIVGDQPVFGPWNPGLHAMTQVDDVTWTTTVQILDGTTLNFKYTRGSWDTVESWGSIVALANRQVTIAYGAAGSQVVDNTATDWGTGSDSLKAVQYWRDPFVLASVPADEDTDVSLDTAIVLTWSLPMVSGTTFSVTGPEGAVAGTIGVNPLNNTTTFTPTASLAYHTTYTITASGQVTSGVPGAESGTQQVPFTAHFTTTPFMVYLPLINR